MFLSVLVLGSIFSMLYGGLFHFWRGGGFFRLIFYLILSWVGFWCGHFIASRLGLSFDKLGDLHLGMATLGSFLFLLGGYWLSLVRIKPKSEK